MMKPLRNSLKPNNKKIIFLSLADAVYLHAKIMDRYGSTNHFIRDKGLLDSAINQPKATVNGKYCYENIYDMAACYLFCIIKNHPFVDGNKRTGLLISLTFLAKNGVKIKFNDNDLYELALSTANSTISFEEIAQYFKNNSR